jgi:phytanoyl-CoA hydroxylase
MRTELSPQQIQSYSDNGFVVIEDFLDTDELADWRHCVDEAVEARQNRKVPGGEMEAGDSYYDQVFTQRLNLWVDHPGMRRLMLDQRLGRMATELADVDGIRIWHDQALIKEPWANPTAWHLDNPYWSFSSHDAISVWVALDDATPHNGCMYFVPGSHREATYDNVGIGENMSGLFQAYPAWKERQSTAAPMRAGSCSFHNGLLAHGAGANMTPGRRRAMTCAYMPDGSTFNGQKNILPQDYFASLKEGDILENNEHNPLIYHHTKETVSS